MGPFCPCSKVKVVVAKHGTGLAKVEGAALVILNILYGILYNILYGCAYAVLAALSVFCSALQRKASTKVKSAMSTAEAGLACRWTCAPQPN
jgi:hypothetical protein